MPEEQAMDPQGSTGPEEQSPTLPAEGTSEEATQEAAAGVETEREGASSESEAVSEEGVS